MSERLRNALALYAEQQEKDRRDGEKRAIKEAREEAREASFAPEARLLREIVAALASDEAVYAHFPGGHRKLVIGPGHPGSGAEKTVYQKPYTVRELRFLNPTTNEVHFTLSHSGSFDKAPRDVATSDLLQRDVVFDDMETNRRLVFPTGFMATPCDPKNARLEHLIGTRRGMKWKMDAKWSDQSETYHTGFSHFFTLWNGRGRLASQS